MDTHALHRPSCVPLTSQSLSQPFDQVHPLVQHGHDDDGLILLDEEQNMVLAAMSSDPLQPRQGSSLDLAAGNPLAASMERILVEVRLGLAPCLLRVEPDVDEVFVRRGREAVGDHLRSWRRRASRLMSSAVAVIT